MRKNIRKNIQKNIIVGIILMLLLTSCTHYTSSSKTLYNTPDSDEIRIGVAYPVELRGDAVYFSEGIEHALDTINADGGVLGKKLNFVIRDDKNDDNLGMQIAQTFCDQGITAVVGHWSTNVCFFVEDLYEKGYQLLTNI